MHVHKYIPTHIHINSQGSFPDSRTKQISFVSYPLYSLWCIFLLSVCVKRPSLYDPCVIVSVLFYWGHKLKP